MRENVYKANVGEIKKSFFLATVLWSLHVIAVSVCLPDVNLLFKPHRVPQGWTLSQYLLEAIKKDTEREISIDWTLD